MRFQTTTPQQALFLLNSPFAAERARDFAARPEVAGADPDQRLQRMYSLAFQRVPSPEERALALRICPASARPLPGTRTSVTWSYGSGHYNTNSGRLEGWRTPRISRASKWQWEAKVPSSQGLWTLLTRDGGRPGAGTNGVVRRWTSPFTGTVRIQGSLNHPAEAGDGVPRTDRVEPPGALGEWTVHHGKLPTGVEEIEVRTGETLDFVVEAGRDENSDSFEWKVDLARRCGAARTVASWTADAISRALGFSMRRWIPGRNSPRCCSSQRICLCGLVQCLANGWRYAAKGFTPARAQATSIPASWGCEGASNAAGGQRAAARRVAPAICRHCTRTSLTRLAGIPDSLVRSARDLREREPFRFA